MWESVKSKQPTVILALEFEDFARIEVEKTLKGTIPQYGVAVEIFDYMSDLITLYALKDVESALETIKNAVETFYDEMPLMNDQEIEEWVDTFQDSLSAI